MPDQFKSILFVMFLALLMCSSIKTDIIFGEINGNLCIVKWLHLLSLNSKSSHKWTEKNFKKLVILSRFVILFIFKFGTKFFSFLIPLLCLIITILSQRLCWWIHFIATFHQFMLIYLLLLQRLLCLGYICLLYYIFRFNQLNYRIKSIIPNGRCKRIFAKREKSLLQLINEHNWLASEIDKLNLLFRKWAAIMFVSFCIEQNLVYLTIYMKHTLSKIVAVNGFIFYFFFGFGFSILFSMQINSAKKSYKIIHWIICKYKMRFQLRLKVNLNRH